MKDFQGRVAVVTGGASGIGLGITKAMLAAGCSVAMLDLREDHISSTLEALNHAVADGRLVAYRVDVSDREAMAAVAGQIVERFGKVDILVNNAGVGIQREWDRVEFADWDFGLQVNLGGVINGIMIFQPMLIANPDGGHIVNTSSLAGLASVPSSLAIYGTAKAAVVALSEAIAPALREKGVGVSILCPGLVRSNIHEIDRNRPARFQGSVAEREETDGDAERAASPEWMEPEQVGEMVMQAIRDEALYIITHPTHRGLLKARAEAILAAWPTDPLQS